MLLFVVICYMSVICYMPVVCLVIGRELGLGYMLFIAHLCNHILLQSGGGPGAQLCTLLEEWVLGAGMSTLGRKRLCTPRVGDLSNDDPGASPVRLCRIGPDPQAKGPR